MVAGQLKVVLSKHQVHKFGEDVDFTGRVLMGQVVLSSSNELISWNIGVEGSNIHSTDDGMLRQRTMLLVDFRHSTVLRRKSLSSSTYEGRVLT